MVERFDKNTTDPSLVDDQELVLPPIDHETSWSFKEKHDNILYIVYYRVKRYKVPVLLFLIGKRIYLDEVNGKTKIERNLIEYRGRRYLISEVTTRKEQIDEICS